jgi:purine-nucleoside phosphorylase
MSETIKKATNWIKERTSIIPETGIILGSGLKHLADKVSITNVFPYSDIPGFPVSGVEGHEGQLIFGTLSGKQVMVMQGRFHFYEGYTMETIALPVRVMKMLGASNLIISNAAGGMHPGFTVGDLMLIDDHINLMGTNPLIGANDDSLGPRFPDMSCVYDMGLRELAMNISAELDIKMQRGVYTAVTGPVYETPAEYRYLYRIGADAVGMSTIPEAIAAHHMGMKILAISVITDLGGFEHPEPISHEQVLVAAEAAEPRLSAIIEKVISAMD